MPRAAFRVSGRRSKAVRLKDRRGISLRDATLTLKTQKLYYVGALKLAQVLNKATSEGTMDDRIADWVQHQWTKGAPLCKVSAALCGLHHFCPWTRRRLPQSWKMFATWRRIEVPMRAPPIPESILFSIANYALSRGDVFFAAIISLGFVALLRTGELLQVTPGDLLLSSDQSLLRLGKTKTSARKGSSEVVPFAHEWTTILLQTACDIARESHRGHSPLWPFSAEAFRRRFRSYLRFFSLQKCVEGAQQPYLWPAIATTRRYSLEDGRALKQQDCTSKTDWLTYLFWSLVRNPKCFYILGTLSNRSLRPSTGAVDGELCQEFLLDWLACGSAFAVFRRATPARGRRPFEPAGVLM